MSTRHGLLVLSAATVAVGLSAAAGAGSQLLGFGTTAEAASGGLRCEIQSSGRSGGVNLSAVVSSSTATNGTYRFTVRQGGSNINQAGDFSLAAGGRELVGEITLGSGSYSAELSISSDKGVSCRDRSSSWL